MTNTTFDIAIIGAGAVGCAIARELSRYELKIVLLDSNPDVGMGTSKASTAIWHTGYDATPGSLEATLLKRSYKLMETFLPEANIAHERLGGLLIAWNQDQFEALPKLLKKARDNGEMDVQIISADEIRQIEPHISQGALGGLFVPGEGILCTYSVPLACAYQAALNGAETVFDFAVQEARKENGDWILSPLPTGRGARDEGEVRACYIINAAGLGSDEINSLFGHRQFKVTPRRGQLIVYDKLARPLVNHILLPVPTSITKGVLISPTVYGNILLGPTAEDLDDKSATETTDGGLKFLLEKGKQILPQLLDEEVTATYSGLRAATEHSDYQIEMHREQKYLCVGGIRSTGISAALGIAEYAVELLREAGLELNRKAEFKPVRLPSIGQRQIRPHQDAEMLARDPSYAQMVCHCERVSRGELRDAMNAPIPATTLDGLRRRTRASQGRCQGFNCHAALAKMTEEKNLTAKHATPALVRLKPHGAREGAKENQIEFLSDLRGVSGSKGVEVLIVGAGPAGLNTAIELKKQGIRDVLVVDREPEAGGMPRFCHHTGFGREDLWRMWSGPKYAKYYRELAEKWEVEICTSTTITGWNAGRKLDFTSPGGLGQIEARAILLATGVRERPRSARLIPGARPQGIFTTGSLQRVVYQEKLPVGKRAVIIGAELVSLSALMTLMHAGVECVAMVAEETRHQIQFPYVAMKWLYADILTRTPIVTNARVTNILGRKRVEGIEITRRLPKSLKTSEVSMLDCDTLIFTGNWIPEHELARLGGLTLSPVTRGPEVDAAFRTSAPGVFAAGNLLRGVETADRCSLEGRRAARSIIEYLRKKNG